MIESGQSSPSGEIIPLDAAGVCVSILVTAWVAGRASPSFVSVTRPVFYLRETGGRRLTARSHIHDITVPSVPRHGGCVHTSHQAASLPRSQMRNKPSKGSQWLVELDSRSVMLWVCWLLTTPLRKWDMQTIPAQQTVNYSSPIYQWFSSFLLWVQIILRRQNKWSEKVNLHTLEPTLSSKVRVSLVRRNWYQWDLLTTVLCSKWKIFSCLPLSISFGPELVRAQPLFYFWDWPNPLDGVECWRVPCLGVNNDINISSRVDLSKPQPDPSYSPAPPGGICFQISITWSLYCVALLRPHHTPANISTTGHSVQKISGFPASFMFTVLTVGWRLLTRSIESIFWWV